MEYLSPQDREIITQLIAELKRFNDSAFDQQVLVSCTEAARLCGVTRPTISAWIKEGRIRKKVIGESVGILLGDIKRISNPARVGGSASGKSHKV